MPPPSKAIKWEGHLQRMIQMAGIPGAGMRASVLHVHRELKVMPALPALLGGMNAEWSKCIDVASAPLPYEPLMNSRCPLFDELISKLSLTHTWNLGSVSCSWTGDTSCAPRTGCHSRAHLGRKTGTSLHIPHSKHTEKFLDSRKCPISATTGAYVQRTQLPPTRNRRNSPLSPGGESTPNQSSNLAEVTADSKHQSNSSYSIASCHNIQLLPYIYTPLIKELKFKSREAAGEKYLWGLQSYQNREEPLLYKCSYCQGCRGPESSAHS